MAMAIPSSPPPTGSQLASDTVLQPFLSASFSPVAYLNSTLPTWTPSVTPTPSTKHVQSLSELTTQTQSHVATLDAKLSRLSATLTQLTDEILRSGGRLGYEVEILRGDVTAMVESLNNELLQESMRRFSADVTLSGHADSSSPTAKRASRASVGSRQETQSQQSPLIALHTLNTARQRLQSVTQTFNLALSWPLAPSALSLKNQFVSISAPSSSSDKVEELEAEGKEWESRIREEVEILMESGEEGDIATARRRVQELRDLLEIWKGTVEEKPRTKVVEMLEILVDLDRAA